MSCWWWFRVAVLLRLISANINKKDINDLHSFIYLKACQKDLGQIHHAMGYIQKLLWSIRYYHLCNTHIGEINKYRGYQNIHGIWKFQFLAITYYILNFDKAQLQELFNNKVNLTSKCIDWKAPNPAWHTNIIWIENCPMPAFLPWLFLRKDYPSCLCPKSRLLRCFERKFSLIWSWSIWYPGSPALGHFSFCRQGPRLQL